MSFITNPMFPVNALLTQSDYQTFLDKINQSKENAQIQMYSEVNLYLNEMYSSVVENAKKAIRKDFDVEPKDLVFQANQVEVSNKKNDQNTEQIEKQLKVPSQKVEKIEVIDLDEDSEDKVKEEDPNTNIPINSFDKPFDLSTSLNQAMMLNAFNLTQMIANNLLNLNAQNFSTPKTNKRKRIEDSSEQDRNNSGNWSEEEDSPGRGDAQSFGCGSKQSMQILSLKCLQDDCTEKFPIKDELNIHLKKVHGILGSRCLQRDCNKSFCSGDALSHHFRDDHSNVTAWNCPKCAKSFKKYSFLYRHFQWSHLRGEYKCTYELNCTYLAQTRGEVYAHCKLSHQSFICAQCGRNFSQIGNLRRHERMHLRIKPYRCIWDGCSYASEFRSTAINHIRMSHFGLPPTIREMKEKMIVDERDPRDFLYVASELLSRS